MYKSNWKKYIYKVVVTGITSLDPTTGGHRRVGSITSYSSLQES